MIVYILLKVWFTNVHPNVTNGYTFHRKSSFIFNYICYESWHRSNLKEWLIRKRHQQNMLVFVNTSRCISDWSSVWFQHQAIMQTLTVVAGMPRKMYSIFWQWWTDGRQKHGWGKCWLNMRPGASLVYPLDGVSSIYMCW